MAKSKTSEPAAEWVPIGALTPWVKNPRKNDAAVAKVADSIKRFGFASPILARRENGEVIAGHTRLKAALSLGLEHVPVRYLDLDPADAHLLALADNKLGEISEWDDTELASILGPLMMEHGDLAEVAGFSDDDIAKLLKSNADAVIEAAEDQSAAAQTGFVVLIECRDEDHQRDLIAELMERGLPVRALT